jgi:hypothetical protein
MIGTFHEDALAPRLATWWPGSPGRGETTRTPSLWRDWPQVMLHSVASRQVSRLGRHGEFVNSALAYAILGVLNITTGFHAGWFG